MLNCTIQANGDLLLTAGNETRAFLKENAHKDFWSLMGEIFEPYFCNGSYYPFDAGDGNPFVGLSSAPCIAESMTIEDDGSNIIEGRFWYYANYMIVNPLDELKNKGRTIFTLA